MENNIIARLAPKNKENLKGWRKQEKAKQEAIFHDFSCHAVCDKIDATSLGPTTEGDDGAD